MPSPSDDEIVVVVKKHPLLIGCFLSGHHLYFVANARSDEVYASVFAVERELNLPDEWDIHVFVPQGRTVDEMFANYPGKRLL